MYQDWVEARDENQDIRLYSWWYKNHIIHECPLRHSSLGVRKKYQVASIKYQDWLEARAKTQEIRLRFLVIRTSYASRIFTSKFFTRRSSFDISLNLVLRQSYFACPPWRVFPYLSSTAISCATKLSSGPSPIFLRIEKRVFSMVRALLLSTSASSLVDKLSRR